VAKNENTDKNCTLEECFKEKMAQLIEQGACNPTFVSMSDWYYMQGHAKECSYCADRFEVLASKVRKKGNFPGPTTLR